MIRIERGHTTIWSAIFILAAIITFANAQYNVDRQVVNERIARLESQVATLSDAQSQANQREADVEQRVSALEANEANEAIQAQQPAQPQVNKPTQKTFGDYVRLFFSDGIPIGGVTP